LRVRDLARVEGAPPIPVRAAGSLEATLRETGGNVSRAARRLGIPRTTLRRRIRAESLHHLIPKD
jgi:transcriptional regulator of acetoin/glycerol metabolism